MRRLVRLLVIGVVAGLAVAGWQAWQTRPLKVQEAAGAVAGI